jgi:hypothetical protein
MNDTPHNGILDHYAECLVFIVMFAYNFAYHYAECHYAECRYAKCCNAKSRYTECRGALQCLAKGGEHSDITQAS